jgi:hypothetical protein
MMFGRCCGARSALTAVTDDADTASPMTAAIQPLRFILSVLPARFPDASARHRGDLHKSESQCYSPREWS